MMLESERLKEFEAEWNDDSDFITAYTSGSTGKPKRIHLLKKDMKASAGRTIRFFGLRPDSYLYSCVSSAFIGGKMMAVRAWELGCSFGFEEPSNNPLRNIAADRTGSQSADKVIDLISIVPSQMVSILQNPGTLNSVKRFLVGGGPVHPILRNEIIRKGVEVWESYGMTETCSHIALRKIGDDDLFEPFEGISVELDSRGCLVIDVDGKKFVTNDLAEIVSGTGFKIIGRYDNMIISGGKKINPEEVEGKIEEWLFREELWNEFSPFSIGGISDSKWGSKVVLVLEGVTKNFPLDHLKDSIDLPGWKLPKEIVFLDKIPYTKNGKIDRLTLGKLLSGAPV